MVRSVGGHHCAAGVLRFLCIGTAEYEITGCWATVLAPVASHKLHSRLNNFLSGVYYVRTGEGADTVNFHDPRKQASVIRPPVTELTAQNTDQVVVRVQGHAAPVPLLPGALRRCRQGR
ncbi:MAG: putative 2OG-Fe(II) oxygenase [Polaromonas sp.]